MTKPINVENNTVRSFLKPLSESYPEIHLQDNGAALILYVSPFPQEEDEGTIVVANFSETNSNLIMIALSKIYDNMSGIVNIRIVAASEENDIAKHIQDTLTGPAYTTQIKNLCLTDKVKEIKIEQVAKDFTVQFNPRFSITSLPAVASTVNSSFSFQQVIRNAFLNSPPKDRPQSGVITDASDIAVRNGPDSHLSTLAFKKM